jgi:RNA polymerase sigma factor (sigma-70 family)
MPIKSTREFEVFLHELLLTPRQVRVRVLERIEALIAEISQEKTYPFDYIVYRITEHRPESVTPLVLSADDAAVELAKLLYETGRSIPVAADSIDEPVLTVGDLASRWKVSPATILRWRREGLGLRLFRFDRGRRKAAARESLAVRFETDRARLIRRARGHRRLSGEERRAVIEEALVGLAREDAPGAILGALSERYELGRGAVERVLAGAAREVAALDAFSRARISGRESEAIFGEIAGGAAVDEVARRHSLSAGKIRSIILRGRARHLLRRPLRAIPSAEFDEPDAEHKILGAVQECGHPAKSVQDELPPYLSGTQSAPLLGRVEEAALFRKYNYLKSLALELRRQLNSRRPDEAFIERIELLVAQADRVRERIVRSNLRLVASIAKRHSAKGVSFQALMSDGNMALLDAVEAFDYSRGNRFSTYAGWAISRRFARTIPEEIYRMPSVDEEVLDAAARVEEDLTAPKPAAVAAGVTKALAELSERERVVLESRFGLGLREKPQTLAELGDLLGVTKERIRQIENQALERLRRIVENTAPELLPE